ncbi:TlpA family protein disulfide reductase [Belliella kenyensis]|uniref:TlpA family protein disulfide reductase n=1 Tax=Belliella kenyensis TaxID=1472724 RepID=A0ABV8EH12_9BACT|nr:TlpA disulfide reductase family protein [Belliella kenyensis]MCH7401746.1 TlpA family protein disulfide reductase [Belliella kenyensis]MDN3604246.1 TlpA disulfide reductase family protein [Belliella kenyensis]
MNWKKEFKSWGLILSIFAFLYFTGLITPIMGGIQSVLLSTGLIKPKITLEDRTYQDFNYEGLLTDSSGNIMSLDQLEGKVLFINIWATWCPPCRAEMPHIASLYEKFEDSQDIVFLLIATDQNFEKSKSLVKDKGWRFPIYHASHGLNSSLHSQSIPTTLVVNSKGKISFYQEGMSNFDTQEFIDFLQKQM